MSWLYMSIREQTLIQHLFLLLHAAQGHLAMDNIPEITNPPRHPAEGVEAISFFEQW